MLYENFGVLVVFRIVNDLLYFTISIYGLFVDLKRRFKYRLFVLPMRIIVFDCKAINDLRPDCYLNTFYCIKNQQS